MVWDKLRREKFLGLASLTIERYRVEFLQPCLLNIGRAHANSGLGVSTKLPRIRRTLKVHADELQKISDD